MRRFKLGSGHNRYGLLDSAGPCWMPLHNETCKACCRTMYPVSLLAGRGSSGFTLLPPPLVLRANTSRLFVRFATIPLLSLALAASASALIRIMPSICTVRCFILRSFMPSYCVCCEFRSSPLPSRVARHHNAFCPPVKRICGKENPSILCHLTAAGIIHVSLLRCKFLHARPRKDLTRPNINAKLQTNAACS